MEARFGQNCITCKNNFILVNHNNLFTYGAIFERVKTVLLLLKIKFGTELLFFFAHMYEFILTSKVSIC